MVKIVVDSSCDLGAELCQEWDMTVVPLKVGFGEEIFVDGVTLSRAEFYQRLASFPGLPSTSQATPAEFAEVYRELTADGSSIISIHMTGKASGTVQSARLGGNMVPEADIEVIDAESLSVGYGLIALRAAMAARAGKSKAEILALVDKLKALHKEYFVVNNLEHLQKGGRIGKATVFLGSLLKIKPLLTLAATGEVYPQEKVRGKAKAVDRILSLFKEQFGQQKVECFVVYGDTRDSLVDKLEEGLRETLNCQVLREGQLGPIVCTHGGPSILGVSCLPLLDD
ncbi:MAG: DegV family protein [Clostridia bacterium]|nr:DegV family protein [Clostridia bacterium]